MADSNYQRMNSLNMPKTETLLMCSDLKLVDHMPPGRKNYVLTSGSKPPLNASWSLET